MGRTEEQKLFQEGVTVVLGCKEYEVKPLKMRRGREWRKKFAALTGELPKYAKITTDDPGAFAGAVTQLLVNMPDKVADLFFDYAGLNKEDFEDEATDAEVAQAFQKVVTLAFPLAGALPEAMMQVK